MQRHLAALVPAAALATALVLGACSSGSSSATSGPPVSNSNVPGAAVDVSVRNFAFDPSSVEVGSNAPVVWTVAEGTHEIAATDGAQFDSGTLGAGNTFTWSPDFSGSRTVSYQCKIHPSQMTGTIEVNG